MDESRISRKKVVGFLKNAGILWALVGMCIILGLLSDNFFKPLNIVTVLKQISILGIVALGSTFVIISGGIDLSVGSIIALSGICAAYIGQVDSGYPLILAIAVAVAVGGAVGLFNGFCIAYGGIPPFIVTLGTMISIRGFANLITDGKPIFNLAPEFADLVNYSVFQIGDVKVPAVIFFLIGTIIICSILRYKTVFGKNMVAVGGNAEAARFSGVNVKAVKMTVYLIAGLLAGLGGVLMASRINSGNATVAVNIAMDAIAASVIGGVSLSGGVGTVWKTIIGVLIIGVILNGLQILGVSSFVQTIVQGLIIIAAVFLDVRTHARA